MVFSILRPNLKLTHIMNPNDERRYNRHDDDRYESRWSNQNENRNFARDRYRGQAEFASGHSGSRDRNDFTQTNDNWRERHDRNYGKFGGDRPEFHPEQNRNYDRGRSHYSSQEYRNYGQSDYDNRNMNERNQYEDRSSREFYGNDRQDQPYGNNYRGQRSQPNFGSGWQDWQTDRGRFDRSRYDGGQFGGQRDAGETWQQRSRIGNYDSSYQDRGGYFGNEGSSGHQSYRGKGPKNYQRSDERIQENINDVLYDHHDIDASDIEVEVNGGTVVLKGEVASRSEKRNAENIIEYISGVNNVENRLHIKSQQSQTRGTGSMDNTREDTYNKGQDSTNNTKAKSAKSTA